MPNVDYSSVPSQHSQCAGHPEQLAILIGQLRAKSSQSDIVVQEEKT